MEDESMSRKPVAIALLACEQVIVEENTHKVTPVNCFVRREFRRSEPVAFSVVAFLTDGTGEINLEIVIIDGPGDSTVRPCPPELLPIMLALKEKRDRIIAEFGPWPPESDSSKRENGPEKDAG